MNIAVPCLGYPDIDGLRTAWTGHRAGRRVQAKQLPGAEGLSVWWHEPKSGPVRVVVEGSVARAMHGNNRRTPTSKATREYVEHVVVPELSKYARVATDPETITASRADTVRDFDLDIDVVAMDDLLLGMFWGGKLKDQRGHPYKNLWRDPSTNAVTGFRVGRKSESVTMYDKAAECGDMDYDLHPLRVEVRHNRDRLGRRELRSLAAWSDEAMAKVHDESMTWAGLMGEFVPECEWFRRIYEWSRRYHVPTNEAAVLVWHQMCTWHGCDPGLSEKTARKYETLGEMLEATIGRPAMRFRLNGESGKVDLAG